MECLRQKLNEALRLAGDSERSRECTVRQVRLFEGSYRKTAEKVTEEDEPTNYLLLMQAASAEYQRAVFGDLFTKALNTPLHKYMNKLTQRRKDAMTQ